MNLHAEFAAAVESVTDARLRELRGSCNLMHQKLGNLRTFWGIATVQANREGIADLYTPADKGRQMVIIPIRQHGEIVELCATTLAQPWKYWQRVGGEHMIFAGADSNRFHLRFAENPLDYLLSKSFDEESVWCTDVFAIEVAAQAKLNSTPVAEKSSIQFETGD